MQFRKATLGDLEQIALIYDRIHTLEERGELTTGWRRTVYPTRETALAAILAGEMFVAEEDGAILASAKLNQTQDPAYAKAAWSHDVPPEQVMVLHTLTVDPLRARAGVGRQFVAYYEGYALDHGCPYLRIDTNERNQTARRLYQKLGYREADIVPCVFNGLEGVNLVCLEKTLE